MNTHLHLLQLPTPVLDRIYLYLDEESQKAWRGTCSRCKVLSDTNESYALLAGEIHEKYTFLSNVNEMALWFLLKHVQVYFLGEIHNEEAHRALHQDFCGNVWEKRSTLWVETPTMLMKFEEKYCPAWKQWDILSRTIGNQIHPQYEACCLLTHAFLVLREATEWPEALTHYLDTLELYDPLALFHEPHPSSRQSWEVLLGKRLLQKIELDNAYQEDLLQSLKRAREDTLVLFMQMDVRSGKRPIAIAGKDHVDAKSHTVRLMGKAGLTFLSLLPKNNPFNDSERKAGLEIARWRRMFLQKTYFDFPYFHTAPFKAWHVVQNELSAIEAHPC